MYVRDLRIQNVKLIRDLSLDFTRDGEPRSWTVLLGENGLCKTTILQCIALAASGPDRANQLADVPSLPDVRNETAAISVAATFELGAKARQVPETAKLGTNGRFDSDLFLPSESSVFEPSRARAGQRLVDQPGYADPDKADDSDVRQLLEDFQLQLGRLRRLRGRNASGLLVVGYGVRRQLPVPDPNVRLADPAQDRIRPLFDAGPVVGTNFVDLLAQKEPELALRYAECLQQALLSVDGMVPRIAGFERRGQGGVKSSVHLTQSHRFQFSSNGDPFKLPATWLSHGYQSTLAWIADLIGQAAWDRGEVVPTAEIEALVLVDELDLHLHPKWQVGFVKALKTVFPKCQFVVTTHSPMLLPGFETDEVVRLGFDDEGSVCVEPSNDSPKLLTGSELYERFFGITDLHPDDLGDALREYSYRASDPGRSNEDELLVKKLRRRLREAGVDPGWDPVPIDESLRP